MRYIAWLRGINVGGKNVIKMEVLKRSFENMGLKNVKTYIQSGNVLFDSTSKSIDAVTKKIEKALFEEYNSDIKVMVRSFSETEELVKRNPFKKYNSDENIKRYVCFSAELIKPRPKVPIILQKEAFEIIAVEDKEIFAIIRPEKFGRNGFSSDFMERKFGQKFTIRNWNTVTKITTLK